MKLPSPTAPLPQMTIRLFWPLLALTGAIGLALRLAHFEEVWTYWSLDYLSYYGPLRDDLGAGLWPWTRLVGLHPPQHGLIVAMMMASGASVAQVIWLSVAFSLAATGLAALTLRQLGAPGGGLVAAAALALSPYQVHYGVELNNYPVFLFGGAALIWAAVRLVVRDTDNKGDLVLLGGAALVTLHGHAAGAALVGTLLLLFLVTWRPRPALALGAALLLFAPVAASMLAMLAGESTFHNAQLPWDEVQLGLHRAWVGRFGSVLGLDAAVLLTLLGLGLGMANGDSASRGWTLAGAALLGTSVAAVFAGIWSGAAQVGQTPYWVVASWLAWVLVGWGWSSAGVRGRVVLGALLGCWLVSAGLPGTAGSSKSVDLSVDSGDIVLTPLASARSAAELRTHLERGTAPGDAVVYLWEPQFLNDSPGGRDPLFGVFAPSEIGDWLGREAPCRNYGFHWMDRSLCVVPASGLRGGEHEERLAADILAWLEGGVTVHLIQAGLDPGKAPPRPEGLVGRVREEADTAHWSESRPGGVRVMRVERRAELRGE
jgi:hypothetical protein